MATNQALLELEMPTTKLRLSYLLLSPLMQVLLSSGSRLPLWLVRRPSFSKFSPINPKMSF